MKMKKYTISVLIFFLLPIVCTAQEKNKLRFDGIYYWDNKKDTVIKNDELHEQLRDNLIFKDTGVRMLSDEGFIRMVGSRAVNLLRFYPDSNILVQGALHENFDIEKANQQIEYMRVFEKENNFIQKYSIKEDTIYFEEKVFPLQKNQILLDNKGTHWNKDLFINHTGIIMQDSIKFKISYVFPTGWNTSMDSIKVFHFVKFK